MMILGIDPGKKGGVVMLDGLEVVYQRAADKGDGYRSQGSNQDPDPGDLLRLWADIMATGRPALAVLETPAWHAGKGICRMNAGVAGRLGIEHGLWRMLLSAHGIPYEVLSPKEWRKRAGITVPKGSDPKAATIARVGALLPGLDLVLPGCRVAHDGLADAAGLALAGRSS